MGEPASRLRLSSYLYRWWQGITILPDILRQVERSSRQVRIESRVLERHARVAKVRISQRVERRAGQALPRDQRLRPALLVGVGQGVVDGPGARVPDQRPRARQREPVGRAGPRAVLRRAHGDDVVGRRRRRAPEPDDGALPVVAVPGAVRGRVFWEIPGRGGGEG